MDENLYSLTAISVSVFTGVLTSGLLLAFANVYNDTILPWYRSQVYRGIKVDDTWEGIQERAGRGIFRFTLRLEQKAQELTGSFISVDEYADGTKDIHECTVSGKIADGWVLLSYFNKDRKSMGLGSLLLQVRDGGKELYGGVMFLKSKNVSVGVDGDLKLQRK